MKNNFQKKIKVLAIAVNLFVWPAALAQPGMNPYYKGAESFAGKTVVIPVGTTFEGRIESTIGSTLSKQGERFTISLSSPILANGSDVIVPAGAQVFGEVVQAIAAKSVPHAKHEKPIGKLRIQVTALKMPDGSTYPMVASIVGEEAVGMGAYRGFGQNKTNPLGSGVAYIGTQPGFQSVAPRQQNRNYGNMNRAQVVTKDELLSDPILGRERSTNNQGTMAIRSLVKKNRNLYIYSGSPLTIRLEAPFKMGIGSSSGEASSLGIDTQGSQIPTNKPFGKSDNRPNNMAPTPAIVPVPSAKTNQAQSSNF